MKKYGHKEKRKTIEFLKNVIRIGGQHENY